MTVIESTSVAVAMSQSLISRLFPLPDSLADRYRLHTGGCAWTWAAV